MTSSLLGCAPFRSYYDIKGRPDEHIWMEACDKEIKKLFEMGTFSIVDETDIPPGHKSINCCMSFKIKKDGDGNILSIAHAATPTAGNKR